MAEKDFVVKNGLVVNTDLIVADGTLNRVGINNSTPDASLTVTGTANVSGNAIFGSTITTKDAVVSNTLSVVGNVSLNNFTLNVGAAGNTLTIPTVNVNVDTGLFFIDALNNRIGVKNTAPDSDFSVTGSANVSGNLTVLGNLIVSGNTVSQGTQQYTGALTPTSNGILLGNTTNRWFLSASNGDFSGNVLISSVLTIGNGTINVVANSTVIKIGNASVNVSINSTAFGGTANNATNLNGQPATYYTNATNITTGTLASTVLPTGNATHIGGLQIVNSLTNTSITATATANNVKTAYDAAVTADSKATSAQSAALSAQTAAIAAYTNATTFAANASNITTGTLPSGRITGAYTGLTQVGTLAGLSVTGNVSLNSNLLFVDATNGRIGVNTSAPSVALQIFANDAIFVPIGTSAQRPTGANGMFRYNVDTSTFEGFANGAWGSIAGSGVGGGYYKGNAGAAGNTIDKGNLYRINSNTQSNNITIVDGENALTAGPMVIANGINLTVETGGRVVIV
jgi:hypothetical protein